MESKQNIQTFMKDMLNQQKKMFQKQNDMFQKHTEILMKHYNDIYKNASTFVSPKQKRNASNYANIYRKLSLYENKISSLNAELDLLKKEKILRHYQLQMNQVNLSNNKEIASIKEYTQELKRVISTIKGEVHDIKKHLIGQPIQGLHHDVHVEKIHTESIRFILELTDKRIATCGGDKSISVVSLDYQIKK